MNRTYSKQITNNSWIIFEYDSNDEVIREAAYIRNNGKLVKHGLEVFMPYDKPKNVIKWEYGEKKWQSIYYKNNSIKEHIDYSNKNQTVSTLYKDGKKEGIQIIQNNIDQIQSIVNWKNGKRIEENKIELKDG